MRDLIFIGVTQQDREIFPTHTHSTWEIHYYFSGEGRTVVGDEEYPFGPGTILFLPPNIPHSEFSVKGYRNIWFSVNLLRSELFNYEGITSSKVLSFEDNQNRDIYNLLLQINREFLLRRHNWRNIVESLLSAITEYLISRNVEERVNPLVEQLKGILVDNINTKGFQVSDAMKRIPLSPDHLRRIFKRETGRNPLDYLNSIRIEYSAKLLELKHLNVKEVADLVGLNDQYYFSRLFKKYTGKSPTEYIKDRSAHQGKDQ